MLVMVKDPNVVMSILVPKYMWPEVVSFMSHVHVTYAKEVQLAGKNGGIDWVKIMDIQGSWKDITSVYAYLEHIDERDNWSNGRRGQNFYAMMMSREALDRARENWKKNGSGSKAGTDGVRGSDIGDRAVDPGNLERDEGIIQI